MSGVVSRIAGFVDQWSSLLLIAAVPFLLFPSRANLLVLAAVPGLWIVAKIARRNPLPCTPLNVVLLLLHVMVLVSLYATYDVSVSLPKIAGMVLGIAVFFAVARAGQRAAGWWESFLLFLATGLGIAVLGVFGTNWLYKVSFITAIVSRLPPRIKGLPGAAQGFSGNELAGAILWVLPVLILLSGLAISHRREIQRVLKKRYLVLLCISLTLATLITGGYLILTQSRSGYIGFAAGAMALVFTPLSTRGRWLLGGVVGVALLVLIAVPSGRDLLVRAVLGANPGLNSALSLDTLEGRVEVWSRAAYGIQDFAFTGMGMNTFRSIVHVLYPLFLVSPDYDISHAHNEFLQVALDLGLPGLIAFLALYMIAFWMLVEIWKRVQPSGTSRLVRAIVLGFGVGLGAHIVYSLTEAVTLGAKPGVMLWMMLGLIAGLYAQLRSGELEGWAGWFRTEVAPRLNGIGRRAAA